MNNTELETYLRLKYRPAEKTLEYLDLLPDAVLEYIYTRITGWARPRDTATPARRILERRQMSIMILQTQYMRTEDIERILYNYCIEVDANALESSVE